MEGLWWLILIVLAVLFGKPFLSSLTNNSNATTTANNVPLVNQPQTVPTVSDNLPVITTQNTLSPPENQAAPWRSICPSPIASATPTNPSFPVVMSPAPIGPSVNIFSGSQVAPGVRTGLLFANYPQA